jgi:hypothetical protein
MLSATLAAQGLRPVVDPKNWTLPLGVE